MTNDISLDLRKSGSNFALLASTRSEQKVKGLPNANLSKRFRTELNEVYKYLFNADLPLEEDSFTFLLKYNDQRFEKIYYPCLVRGSADNENAPDSDSLYIRWGNEYKALYHWTDTKGKKVVNHLSLEFGSQDILEETELDFTISSYAFNGEKYLDPCFKISFMNDDQDSYNISLPIKLKISKEEGETTAEENMYPVAPTEQVDYVSILNGALKRGFSNFLALISSSKEYKNSVPALNVNDLEVGIAYFVTDYRCFTASNNKEYITLTLQDGREVWCPYSLQNLVKNNADKLNISDKTPAVLAVGGTYTQLAKNGKEYVNAEILFSFTEESLFRAELFDNGYAYTPAELDAFREESKKELAPYLFGQTLSDRDLDIGVEFSLLSYEALNTKSGGITYKLHMIDPRTDKKVVIWCPNSLIPTIMQKPIITPELPSIFRVVSKKENKGKTYADSQILLASGAIEDMIDLNF